MGALTRHKPIVESSQNFLKICKVKKLCSATSIRPWRRYNFERIAMDCTSICELRRNSVGISNLGTTGIVYLDPRCSDGGECSGDQDYRTFWYYRHFRKYCICFKFSCN